MNIDELTTKYTRLRGAAVYTCHEAIRGALTEQAAHYEQLIQAAVDEAVESRRHEVAMHAVQQIKVEIGQSVPVVGDAVAWVRKDQLQHVNMFGPALCHVYATEQPGTVALIEKPTNAIPAAELATLREKAAMADELQKRAERMQKALSDIAEWTDRYTTPGHPVSTIASAAIAQEQTK